jgi:hypothetical protein
MRKLQLDDVIKGLKYLHSVNIVHGDLCGVSYYLKTLTYMINPHDLAQHSHRCTRKSMLDRFWTGCVRRIRRNNKILDTQRFRTLDGARITLSASGRLVPAHYSVGSVGIRLRLW